MINHHTAKSLHPGAVLFDRFVLIAPLGEGGFGTVWRAQDKRGWRDVALKVLSRVDMRARIQFQREFHVARRFAHPNLVQLGELFGSDDLWAFSMELIEGVDLLEWLLERPPTAAGGEALVRECFAQLASGLAALHRVGVVHRDIKPSNVLVTHQGRVVIVDFGLLSSRGERSESHGQYAVGTFAYMAPEQAQGAASSASDLYAVGVVLYEALTGQVPFGGDAESGSGEQGETQLERVMRMLRSKLSQVPIAPKTLVPAISDELNQLTLELVSPQPAQRPTASALLKRLDHGAEPTVALPSFRSVPFVGRELELGQLAELLDAPRQCAQLVLIEAGAGLGKSALLEQFLVDAKQRAQPPLILSGRCHAFEHVRYNAFDEIFAQLARLAGRRMADDAQPRAAAPAQFVAALYPSIRRPPESSQRSRLFDSLLELLTHLAAKRPVLIAIDDLQWADHDSLQLLSHLLKNSQHRNWLIVAAQRGDSLADAATPAVALARKAVQRIALKSLPRAEAQSLAISLLGSRPAMLPRLLEQAGGHPLYLQELALLSDQPETLHGVLSVERAIAWRAGMLEHQARRALEVVCVAGTPLTYGVLAAAAGLDLSSGELYRVLSLLQEQRMVVAGSRDATASPYHDRVRETVVGQLDVDELKRTHMALARTWESAIISSPENAARHYLAAQEEGLALAPLRAAAQQAFEMAAYARAIALCSRWLAIVARAGASEHRFEMIMMYSDALAFSGAYSQSVEVLQSWGAGAARNDGDHRELMIRSAERLLQSAAIEAGVSAAIRALAAVKVDLPRSDLELVAKLVSSQVRARLERRSRAQVEAGPNPRLVEQLDTLWRLIQPLYFADLSRSTLTGAQHFSLAGKVRDRGHLILSCAANSVMEATREPASERSVALLAQAEDLSKQANVEPSTRAYVAFARGARALFSGNTREAIFSLKDAELIYRTQCPQQAWLQAAARGSYLRALFFRGKHRIFQHFARGWTRDARLRADAAGFAQYAILGQAALRHLMDDDPQAALDELDEALRPWQNTRLGIVPWLYLLTMTTVVSYSPSILDSGNFKARTKLPHKTKTLIKIVPVGVEMSQILASTAWALQQPGLTQVDSRLVSRAKRASHKGPAWAIAMVNLSLAQLLLVNRCVAEARSCARRASELFTQLGYPLYGQAADIVAAVTEFPADPLRRCEPLRTRLEALGWKSSERALGCYLPITRHWRARAVVDSRGHLPAPSAAAASACGS